MQATTDFTHSCWNLRETSPCGLRRPLTHLFYFLCGVAHSELHFLWHNPPPTPPPPSASAFHFKSMLVFSLILLSNHLFTQLCIFCLPKHHCALTGVWRPQRARAPHSIFPALQNPSVITSGSVWHRHNHIRLTVTKRPVWTSEDCNLKPIHTTQTTDPIQWMQTKSPQTQKSASMPTKPPWTLYCTVIWRAVSH